ncbi:Ribosome production factor 1 [Brettanomyces nanus]|uniref:Ribosome production factor 1 n=1 Tax=Eeniella nana TaxID=13502 RepID=A0A875S8T0_EENNA|nr:Ribosome production factor 1 [Brettanomyces nanus]QPG75494.1 Ribosome production factor 1 [Brettanomyces nanus]
MPKSESDILKKIRNKELRRKIYAQIQNDKTKERLTLRKERAKEEQAHPELKTKRLEENVPDTIESKRVYDETVNAEIEGEDDFDEYFKDLEKEPKILITTSAHAHKEAYEFAAMLIEIFPNCTFVKRKRQYSMKEMAGYCSNREFTHLIVINEDKKVVNGMTIMHLPKGPTFYFSIGSLVQRKQISGHGRPTDHIPELILNNFTTRLGKTVSRLFQSLLPHKPEFKGRQVITLHNQRDFIFFRMHRYVFKDNERVGLQELGPEFTLRLRRIQNGIKEEVDWEFRPDMDRDKKKFYL